SVPVDTEVDDGELVATEPSHEVLGSCDVPQASGADRQDLVAHEVTVLVVDLLEPIDVDEGDGVAGTALLEPGEGVEERVAVGEPGQGVAHGQVVEAVHGVPSLEGDGEGVGRSTRQRD